MTEINRKKWAILPASIATTLAVTSTAQAGFWSGFQEGAEIGFLVVIVGAIGAYIGLVTTKSNDCNQECSSATSNDAP